VDGPAIRRVVSRLANAPVVEEVFVKFLRLELSGAIGTFRFFAAAQDGGEAALFTTGVAEPVPLRVTLVDSRKMAGFDLRRLASPFAEVPCQADAFTAERRGVG